VSYIGVNNDIIGINQMDLLAGPFGFSNLGDCLNCVITPTSTPTNTPTQTPTQTPTPTVTSGLPPTPSPTVTPTPCLTYYVFTDCTNNSNNSSSTLQVVVQTVPATPTTIVGNVLRNPTTGVCWKFIGSSLCSPGQFSPNTNVITWSGNYFTGFSTYPSCNACSAAATPTTTTTTTVTPQPCTMSYTHTKTYCSWTTGNIKVNGVIVYTFQSSLAAGVYSNTFSVQTGAVVSVYLQAMVPSSFCTSFISNAQLSIGSYNNSVLSIDQVFEINYSFTVTTANCGVPIIITSTTV
jgi:hypothetical protein